MTPKTLNYVMKEGSCSGNNFNHSVHNRLYSHLLAINRKIKTKKTVIFPAVLYGCVIGLFTVKDEQCTRLSEM